MFHRLSRRGLGALALTAATALAVSACGSGGGAGTGGADDPVRIGYFPLVHTASVVHADQGGAFEAEGMQVELMQTAGGAQAIPSLMAGEYDITYGNYTSAILAAQQGLPVRFVAGNDIGNTDHGIMVAQDSPMREPTDLAGGSVAVNNLENIGTVGVQTHLEGVGVDPASIRFVELPLPEMQAALDRGDVDAIWQVEPFRASALAGGARELFPLFSGASADMPVAGWLTTEQYAQENPEAIASFSRALTASAGELQDDRERLVELVPSYTQVPAEVVEQIEMPRFEIELETAQVQRIADLMHRFEIIDAPFDAASMVLPQS
ncbi:MULTISPECIES: ABC transporter substrate-binding protein [Pseudonocardia]|uniref:Sulfonate ABC transporter substrate-binding protein n=1 Tax=Pseudonocardia saturnea TaxID=33909 RepID=A0ABQ0RR93_9PSEU|nr:MULTISPECIES: ABC transporter substrate-binding protein [Pseudonocardia]BBG02024.1 sulfonate ABC transporter substrate-binding protein [Pseudonocardia autotrophica]GEC23187.1 sulfonate ABC transporter substrate-binding protein [Pseudonocardia saturnea]